RNRPGNPNPLHWRTRTADSPVVDCACSYPRRNTLPRKRFSLLLTLLLGSVLAISGVATTATAAGSDSPVPYTVSAGGLTLPVGHIFSANQEINYTVSKLNGTGKQTLGVGNNIPHNGV